ncbi:MAG: hypothetical protein D6698_11635 [Gammaproteobacteria bacterium]|nr:MAG: hypothetical protein D6698_11635 [Gammaproteobacteria bacterium]
MEGQMDAKVKKIWDLIEKSNGKFFSVEFEKKDGSIRKMTARTNVRKYVTGGGLKFDPKKRGLVVVWEPAAAKKTGNGYRMVSVARVKKIKVNGQEHVFA